MLTMEQMKAGALAAADTAAKVSGELFSKGKQQVELMRLDAKLAKAQRQLGALVYALHKTGEQNSALVRRYMETIAEIEQQQDALRAQKPEPDQAAAAVTVLCPTCGAEVDEDAIFCPGCGNKL